MTSEQLCDHTSVGAVIYNPQGQILMFERGTPPWGIAGPAGHLDGDTYEDGLRREVYEEVGLQIPTLRLITSFRIEKRCRRDYEGDPYHDWQFYEVEASGTLSPSERETKGVRWYTPSEISQLMLRTHNYHLLGMISEQEYQASPGLDLSWFRLFHTTPSLLLSHPLYVSYRISGQVDQEGFQNALLP